MLRYFLFIVIKSATSAYGKITLSRGDRPNTQHANLYMHASNAI